MARKSKYDALAGLAPQRDTRWISGLYLRLSVEDGDDEEYNSIGNQRKICMAYLQDHEELQFGGVYSDNGCTGMNYNRPGFQALLADLRTGKINCIIVKDISRLGRHYILTSEYVERVLPEMGVRLISVNDNYDSKAPDSDRDNLLMPFKLIMNDTYVKDTSKRIRSSISAKMHTGEYLPSAGSVPYGYQRAPENCTYTVDSEAAPIVRRIFEMRANGMAFHAIAKQLNMDRVLCPGKLRYERGVTKAAKYADALWIRGTIRKITGDVVYLGNRVYGRVTRERLGAEKKRRPQDEWQIVPNAHPPIITQELFDRVQEVNRIERERVAGFEQQPAPEIDYRTVLQGKVFCGDCGSRMTAGKRTSRKTRKKGPRLPSAVFYNCNEYRDSGHGRCSNHYIAEETIIRTLTDFLNEQIRIFADVESMIREAKRNRKTADAFRSRIVLLRNRREELEAGQLRCLEDLTAGILDRETYQLLKEKCQQELRSLTEQENEVHAADECRKTALTSAETWLAAVRRYQELPALNRGIVDALVDRILIFEDKSVRICLTYQDPLSILKNDTLSEDGGYSHVG